MLPLTAIKKHQEQGFNLLEITIVLLIAGILAAISAPNLLGWYRRTQLDNAVVNVKGALQQAQRTAIRDSQQCTVTIDATGIASSCASTRSVPDFITVQKRSSNDIQFGFRGTINQAHVITFETEAVTEPKCLEIASPLGIMREGIYRSEECQKP